MRFKTRIHRMENGPFASTPRTMDLVIGTTPSSQPSTTCTNRCSTSSVILNTIADPFLSSFSFSFTFTFTFTLFFSPSLSLHFPFCFSLFFDDHSTRTLSSLPFIIHHSSFIHHSNNDLFILAIRCVIPFHLLLLPSMSSSIEFSFVESKCFR